MATEIRQELLDAAGLAMRELRKAGNPTEAQICMAMMAAYLCSQYEIEPDQFGFVLAGNIKQVGSDTVLMPRLIDRIHQLSTQVTGESSPIILTSGSTGPPPQH